MRDKNLMHPQTLKRVADLHAKDENFPRHEDGTINHAALPDPVNKSRPWGYKGPQVLPKTHPDHPEYKGPVPK